MEYFNILVLFYTSLHLSLGCVPTSNYSVWEQFLLTEENLQKLQEAFFPTDQQNSIVVDVYYHFYDDTPKDIDLLRPSSKAEEKSVELNFRESPPQHRFLRNAMAEKINMSNITNGTLDLKFRWMASPINLYIRPKLLQFMSLFAYQAQIMPVHLDLPSPCIGDDAVKYFRGLHEDSYASDPYSQDGICNTKNYNGPIHLLNNLTANLYSYALHRTSVFKNGIQSDKEKGYSVFFFKNDNPSDYCVISKVEKFRQERLYLHIAEFFLLSFVMLAVPIIFIASFEIFKENLMKKSEPQENEDPEDPKEKKSDMRYFVWSLVVVIIIATILMLINDFVTNVVQKTGDEPDIKKNFEFYLGAMLVCITFDFLCALLAFLYLHKVKRADIQPADIQPAGDSSKWLWAEFPVPNSIKFFVSHPKTDRWKKVLRSCNLIILFASVYFFTLFFQFICFHTVYIVLGSIASPVETLSLTSFYVASFFCMVVFAAVLLKVIDQDGGNVFRNGLRCILPVISALFFLFSCAFYIVFFYLYTTMVQVYRTNGGVLTIIGSFLPTALISVAGFCGARLIKCIKNRRVTPITVAGPAILPASDQLATDLPTSIPPQRLAN